MTTYFGLAAFVSALSLSVSCADSTQKPAASNAETTAISAKNSPNTTKNTAPCPSPKVIETLHATAYYLEHGSSEEGTRHMENAAAIVKTTNDKYVGQIFDRLSQGMQNRDSSIDLARIEFSEARRLLTDWECLTEDLHQAFHRSLDDPQGTGDTATDERCTSDDC